MNLVMGKMKMHILLPLISNATQKKMKNAKTRQVNVRTYD